MVLVAAHFACNKKQSNPFARHQRPSVSVAQCGEWLLHCVCSGVLGSDGMEASELFSSALPAPKAQNPTCGRVVGGPCSLNFDDNFSNSFWRYLILILSA